MTSYFEQQLQLIRQALPKVQPGQFKLRDVIAILGGLGMGCVVIYCGKIFYSYRFFKRMGLPTPPVKFLTGNYHEIIENNYSDQLRKWTQLLGSCYGYYEGHIPILVTSDPDFIQEVYITQSSNFTARKLTPLQVSDEDRQLNMFLSVKNRWKRMRNIISPTFSNLKLKELLPLLKMCTKRFVHVIDENVGQEIDIKRLLDLYTLDVINNCAFGMDINCLSNPDNSFLRHSMAFFDSLTRHSPAIILGLYFTELKPIMLAIVSIATKVFSMIDSKLEKYGNPHVWLCNHVGKLIDLRLSFDSKPRDYMQILLEAQSEDFGSGSDESTIEKKMTLDEIKVNLVMFMLAGYDTTSNTLAYCAYVLATHPEEQAKLQDEIDEKFGLDSNIEPDFESVSDLPYLDMFIKETLRMYPVANNAVNRRCVKDCTIGGKKIPAGLVVAVDAMTLHNDPEYWGPVDPHEFYPLRFSPDQKRHPCVYMPFGLGPRNCVGMKFALLEIKLALIKILIKYELVASENTPKRLEFEEGILVRRAKGGIPIQFKKRQN